MFKAEGGGSLLCAKNTDLPFHRPLFKYFVIFACSKYLLGPTMNQILREVSEIQ